MYLYLQHVAANEWKFMIAVKKKPKPVVSKQETSLHNFYPYLSNPENYNPLRIPISNPNSIQTPPKNV
jgi:hypothetical protein